MCSTQNNQFGFLSVIVDGYNDSKLVMNNPKSAISKIKDIKDLVFHTDYGIQYTLKMFQNYIDKSKITHSMSRIGNSLDNTPLSFFT